MFDADKENFNIDLHWSSENKQKNQFKRKTTVGERPRQTPRKIDFSGLAKSIRLVKPPREKNDRLNLLPERKNWGGQGRC